GSLPPLMVIRSLVLNAPIGLLCGGLFWTYGIEAAIIAHFSADIVYHVFGTFVLRRKLAANGAWSVLLLHDLPDCPLFHIRHRDAFGVHLHSRRDVQLLAGVGVCRDVDYRW